MLVYVSMQGMLSFCQYYTSVHHSLVIPPVTRRSTGSSLDSRARFKVKGFEFWAQGCDLRSKSSSFEVLSRSFAHSVRGALHQRTRKRIVFVVLLIIGMFFSALQY